MLYLGLFVAIRPISIHTIVYSWIFDLEIIMTVFKFTVTCEDQDLVELKTSCAEVLRKVLAQPETLVVWHEEDQSYPLPEDLLLGSGVLLDVGEILREYTQDLGGVNPYADGAGPPELLREQAPQMVLQYHGLDAYIGRGEGLLQKALACREQDIVICGSDEAIGPVGLIFEGPVYKAWASDVWSLPEERNAAPRDRGVSERHFRAVSRALRCGAQYMETWTKVHHLYGIWCDLAADEEGHRQVVDMASALGLPMSYKRPRRMSHYGSSAEALDALFEII